MAEDREEITPIRRRVFREEIREQVIDDILSGRLAPAPALSKPSSPSNLVSARHRFARRCETSPSLGSLCAPRFAAPTSARSQRKTW